MCSSQVLIANPLRHIPGEPYHRTVPCGECTDCLNRRSNHWFIRLMHESKLHAHVDFVTLTYSTPPRSPNGYFTAKKKDVQDFIKRLRKLIPYIMNDNGEMVSPVKYYANCEYGPKDHRPHYHFIMFGVQDKRNYLKAWNQPGQGIVDIDIMHPGQVRYVTGYIEKRIGIPWTLDDDRTKEWSLMSKKLGTNFLQTAGLWNAKYQDSTTVYQGVTYSIPRYYKDKLWPDAYSISYKPHPTKVYKTGKRKGQPVLMQSKKILFHHPTKKLVNEKNASDYLANEARLIKNFNSVQDFRKNQQEISLRNSKNQRIVKN